jgi:hypothetical protein
MTNRELLNVAETQLGPVDKQRLFLLRVEGTAMPCPACKKAVNLFDAAGFDIDGYDFGKTEYRFHCPHCQAVLEQAVPALSLGPLWHWRLQDDWLREQLDRARPQEQSHGKEES